MEINKIYQYIIVLIASITLFSCSDDDVKLISTNFYYLTDEHEITVNNITGQDLKPTAMAISGEKLYVCNNNEVLVFDLNNYDLINTITTYKKGNTEIQFNNLSSIYIHNGKIYIGSIESRLFILDESTYDGFSVLGNGQWWNTFVHVFGVAVSDEYIFVKEKEQIIKVFDLKTITETSNWNLPPVAKLTTNTGGTEYYNLKIQDENLVVAGQNAGSYLYYNIESVKRNAEKSLEKNQEIKPRTASLNSFKPIAVTFTEQWAVSIENNGNTNFIKMYPKQDFMYTKYNAVISNSNSIGQPNFGTLVDVVTYNDLIIVSDNSNKKVRILKLKSSSIQEK
jgi:hypothetical protein